MTLQFFRFTYRFRISWSCRYL